MAASRFQFNGTFTTRTTAQTLGLLVLKKTCDYTNACQSFSRRCCQVSGLSNNTTVDALRPVAKLVHSQLVGQSIFCNRRHVR